MARMMNQATLDFIRQHQDDDVRQLAFLGSKHPDVDMPFALDQIRGRKIACAKLPRWAARDGIIYPPHISMEQCSSESTALYKAHLAARLLGMEEDAACPDAQDGHLSSAVEFVDLTGGFGVDFSYMAFRLGCKSMYVERQPHLCEMAQENFRRLGLAEAVVENVDGTSVLHSFADHSLKLIFIDPARRDDVGNKVVSLRDCTPDVTLLCDEMLLKSRYVMMKLSPMLDWHRAVEELRNVVEVHVVSTANECKELLLVLSAEEREMPLRLYCSNDRQVFSFSQGDEALQLVRPSMSMQEMEGLYLYEPNASLMKVGCFGVISARYPVRKLAKNSHLFISPSLVESFPGRTFRIRSVSSLNKKELKRHLQGLPQANIAVRNFPLSVPELRKRLKLKDGGNTYIFATTLADDSHVLLVCEKA